MTDEDRPVHHTVDCSTGEVAHVLVTDEELAGMAEKEKEAAERLLQEEADEEALRQLVLNHQDPVVKMLGAKLGYR